MRVRVATEIEVPITRTVSIGDGRTDDIEEGTRTVHVEVSAEVLYDEAEDDCALTDITVHEPHGWAWSDLEQSDRVDLEGMLCQERHDRERRQVKTSDALMGTIASLAQARRQLGNVTSWSQATPELMLSALGALLAELDRHLGVAGQWVEARGES
jgi:hypothetical protein